MSLTRNEIVRLLAVVAVLDDRDTDDALLIDAWHAMAEEGQWPSYAAAHRALLVYRSEHPDFPVRPGHVTQVLRRVRAAASAANDPERERVPPEVMAAEDFDAAYMAWIKGCAATHGQRYMAAFAAGTIAPPKALEAGS